MELELILFLVVIHLSAVSALPVESTASPGGAALGRSEATPSDEAPRSKVKDQPVEWNGRRRAAHLLDTLDDYDLSTPSIVDHRGQFVAHVPHPGQESNPRRHRRQAPPGDEKWIYFRLTAFGREFQLNVTESRDFVSPSLTVEYWNGSGLVSRTQRKEQHDGLSCHFVGHVASDDKTSRAAVSNCHGLHGVFATPDDEYLIEPFWADENGTSNSQFYHIIYRRSAIRKTQSNSQCGVTDLRSDLWISKGDRFKRKPHFRYEQKDKWRGLAVEKTGRTTDEGRGERRTRRSAVSKRSYVETLVVADKEMVTYHGLDQLEPYLLTVMNIVARLFHDESIGNDVNIIVTRIIILTTQQPGLQISYHADRSLESFCLWQQKTSSSAEETISNRVDQEIASHDNAVLLTRFDICTYKNLPCGTLGLAPVAGMCEPYRSCSINEDIGLATAFTVAHEIGHNFGMQHDGAGNDCGIPGHEPARIMAAQLAKNREPFSWSSCSRNYITNFLDSGRGRCLENHPSQETFHFPDRLAGETHDGDSQCRLLFGPSSTQCKWNEEVCRELWCINPNNRQCVTNSIPSAEGTPCVLSNGSSTEGWCYRGRCVRTDWRPQPLDGQWGEWSSWGQCSRTCGGGVESSDRKCDRPRPTDGGKFCTGERLRYRSCNTQDCAPNSTDFRELQCAKFNDQLFRNKFYKWNPFTGGHVRPCALNCLAVGFNFYTERSAKVIDGTSCYPDSLDICVNGECRHVGCDRILGSNAREDKCRVCGGDGSTCETTRGRVDQPMDQEASDTYLEIARVPQGAVHIRFAETRLSKNYLALKSPEGRFFVNGAWTIDWPRSFEVAETVFRYERSKDRPETLTAIGPTSADLVLMILVQETSLNVEYEYNVATVSKGTQTTSSDYTWQYLQWNECSVTCGKGISRSVAVCVMASDKTLVKNTFCLSIRPQPDDRVKFCAVQPCPPEWTSGEWTECSRTCGGGLRTRRVVCTRRVSAGETEVLDPASCPGKRPKYKWRCNEEACPLQWQTDDWSECRPPCGPGIRTRNVYCLGVDGSFLPTDHCDSATRPSGQEECQMTACPPPKWTTGAWGECSSQCDGTGGFQMRTVACRTYNGEPSNSCDHRSMPSNRQECQGRCAGHPTDTRKPEECMDINKVEYCPLVSKFQLCSRPYFRQACCQTCTAAGL